MSHQFHCSVWKVLNKIIRPFIVRKFNLESERVEFTDPCIIISNHVTDYDPLLLALSFPDNQFYFVASEHIFRLGFASKLLEYFLAPIPKKKAFSDTSTVKSCLKHLKQGHSICIFAEGDASWDGLTHEIVPSTGKLVKSSGASLLTYKLEGAYLSRPRWKKKISKGKVYGHKVKLYSPEELKSMSAEEITQAINADIFENAWDRQKLERTVYDCSTLADNIDQLFYVCPSCKKIGTIKGAGNRIFCSDCDFETFFNDYGFFEPAVPFENVAQWDKWQQDELLPKKDASGELFSDDELTLKELSGDHLERELYKGKLTAFTDRIKAGEFDFNLSDIQMMAMVQKKSLLFLHKEKYYELKAEKLLCLRKYLTIWNNVKS